MSHLTRVARAQHVQRVTCWSRCKVSALLTFAGLQSEHSVCEFGGSLTEMSKKFLLLLSYELHCFVLHAIHTYNRHTKTESTGVIRYYPTLYGK